MIKRLSHSARESGVLGWLAFPVVAIACIGFLVLGALGFAHEFLATGWCFIFHEPREGYRIVEGVARYQPWCRQCGAWR